MLLLASAMRGADPEPALDWQALAQETLEHLQALVQIDTTNPPGHERPAAGYLQEVLAREGISSELLETAPGRAALLARLPATQPAPEAPLLLMGHIDVVGVEGERWEVDPFAGTVRNGAVWGRGTLDDKGMVAAELMTVVLLKRHRIPLRRDVIFLAEPDEEGGGTYGIDYLVEHHGDKLHAGFALNEGGRILERDNTVQLVGIQTSEKRSVNLTLVARGVSGHASLPHDQNPIVRLSVALTTLAAHQAPPKLTPVTARFFANLAKVEASDAAEWMHRLADPKQFEAAAEELSRRSVHWSALLRNTVAPTVLRGGFRSNVIPAEARATINLRLLPGEELEDFVEDLRNLVDDPMIEFVYEPNAEPEPPASPTDGAFYQVLEQVAGEMFPQAAVSPYMHQAATDSGALRARGVETYGLLVFPLTPEELLLLHADNERLRLSSLRRGLEYLYRVVRTFAGAHRP